MFLSGFFLTVFGLKILFQKNHVERIRAGIWKESEILSNDKDARRAYRLDKYVRGTRLFLVGLIILIYSIALLLEEECPTKSKNDLHVVSWEGEGDIEELLAEREVQA